MSETATAEPDAAPERTDYGVSEAACTALVAEFYRLVRQDPALGPWFNAAVSDWPAHEALVADFWSAVIRGTQRYRGCVMGAHGQLAITEAQMQGWLTHFRTAAAATMPQDLVPKLMAFAERLGTVMVRPAA